MVGKRGPQNNGLPEGYDWYKPFNSNEDWIVIVSFSGCSRKTICKLAHNDNGYYLKEFKGQQISKAHQETLQSWVDRLNSGLEVLK